MVTQAFEDCHPYCFENTKVQYGITPIDSTAPTVVALVGGGGGGGVWLSQDVRMSGAFHFCHIKAFRVEHHVDLSCEQFIIEATFLSKETVKFILS